MLMVVKHKEHIIMLLLPVLMPFIAFIGIKCFACLSARLCQDVVDLEVAGWSGLC